AGRAERGAAPARVSELAAVRREPQAAVVEQLGVAAADETVHLLRDGRGGDAEPLHEAGPNGADALLLELEDGLEVLLGRIVHLGHGRTITPEPAAVPSVVT